MRTRIFFCLLVASCCGLLAAGPVQAENEGQESLDKAIEAKVKADSVRELGRVIELCEKAIEQGLDADNTDFAKKLLAATLQQRASAIGEMIARSSPADPAFLQQYPRLRQMAVEDLERSVENDGENSEAYYLLGKMQSLPGGSRDEALQAFDKAVLLSTGDNEVQAKALVARGTLQADPEKGLADFDQAVKLNPQNAEALRARAVVRLQQSKWDEGLADLDAAIKIDPKHSGTYEVKGAALASMKKFDEALETLDKAIELEPRSATAYLYRGKIHQVQNNPKEAIHDFDKVLLFAPDNLEVLLLRAGAHQQDGDLKRAMADVEQMLALKPGLVIALRAKAALLAGKDEFDEAIEVLNEVVQDQPDDPVTRRQIAELYALTKQTPKAIEAFTEAIKLEPEEVLAYQGRADTYLRAGNQARAMADYEECLKRDPENSGVLNNMAWLLATSPDDSLRSGKRAIELATKAAELTEHKQAHILSTLAAAYAETGDFKTAMEWSAKSVELSSEDLKSQTAKELDSYKAGKPWRELLNEESAEQPEEQDGAEDKDGAAETGEPSDADQPGDTEEPGNVDQQGGRDETDDEHADEQPDTESNE